MKINLILKWQVKLWGDVREIGTGQDWNQYAEVSFFFVFKGTVSVISRDSPCKDGYTWFKTISFKPESYKKKCGR